MHSRVKSNGNAPYFLNHDPKKWEVIVKKASKKFPPTFRLSTRDRLSLKRRRIQVPTVFLSKHVGMGTIVRRPMSLFWCENETFRKFQNHVEMIGITNIPAEIIRIIKIPSQINIIIKIPFKIREILGITEIPQIRKIRGACDNICSNSASWHCENGMLKIDVGSSYTDLSSPMRWLRLLDASLKAKPLPTVLSGRDVSTKA